MSPPDTLPAATPSTAAQIEWLVDTFGATLYHVAFTIVRDRGTAEDVVQEVLVKAWSSMPSWEGDTPIRWARTVTRNAAITALRSQAVRPAVPTEQFDAVVHDGAGPDEMVVRAMETDRMWYALGRLGEDERAMLVLHEIDGVSYEELASTFDISVSAVKSRLYRARTTLRRAVAS